MSDSPQNIIDARRWLLEHVDRLLESDDGAAIPYLERLLVSSEDSALRAYCLKSLGLLYLGRGERDEARKYLSNAVKLAPTDPQIRHALGEIAASAGNLWLALLEFMEAIHHGRADDAIVDYMRSVATTLRQLELGEAAIAVLNGAYERKPDDPWVLESIARIHAAESRWLDAIEARDSLLQALEAHRALPEDERPRLPAKTLERLENLSEKMRSDFTVVNDDYEARGPSGVARRNSPSGLHTLIEALGLRTNNLPLLATAEALWARALHDKFDVHLTIPTLAAAIHWIVERMHWRVPTTLDELAVLYGADSDRLPAAVRLLVACLRLELIPMRDAELMLPAEDLRRLEKLQKAILYDVDLDDVEPRGMLGGDDD